MVSLGQDTGQGSVGEGGEGRSVGVGGFLLGGETDRKEKRVWWERPETTPLSDARVTGPKARAVWYESPHVSVFVLLY